MYGEIKRFIRAFLFHDTVDTIEVVKSVTFDKNVTVNGTLTATGFLPADMALADGKILIGNSSNVAAPVNLSGDITILDTGVVSIGTGKVTSSMLANGAGWAALATAGMGKSAAYPKTTNGVQTLATGTVGDKAVLFIVTVTEAFVTIDTDTQTTFAFGQVGTANKFAETSLLTDATLGQIKIFGGTLTASTNLIVTAAQAVGTGTGAVSVCVLILPSAS